MFMGEYHHNIDDKGRVVIPANLRALLGDNFIITRGIEKCLYVYTLEAWQKLVDKLALLPFTKKDARIFTRTFFAAAANCTFDKQGRVSIMPSQLMHANITKECVIVGVNDRVEIWSKENFQQFNLEYSDALESISENLFNGEE